MWVAVLGVLACGWLCWACYWQGYMAGSRMMATKAHELLLIEGERQRQRAAHVQAQVGMTIASIRSLNLPDRLPKDRS